MDWHNNIIFFCGFAELLSPYLFLTVKFTLFQIRYAIYSKLNFSIQLSLYYNSHKNLQAIQHIIIIYLFTAIGLLPGGSGYFTCKQNMKLVTTRFKSGALHEKHVVATWNLGNHLRFCL